MIFFRLIGENFCRFYNTPAKVYKNRFLHKFLNVKKFFSMAIFCMNAVLHRKLPPNLIFKPIFAIVFSGQ